MWLRKWFMESWWGLYFMLHNRFFQISDIFLSHKLCKLVYFPFQPHTVCEDCLFTGYKLHSWGEGGTQVQLIRPSACCFLNCVQSSASDWTADPTEKRFCSQCLHQLAVTETRLPQMTSIRRSTSSVVVDDPAANPGWWRGAACHQAAELDSDRVWINSAGPQWQREVRGY